MRGPATTSGRLLEPDPLRGEPTLDRVHRSIDAYYSARAVRFGATPAGADWTCIASQQMRFVQLLRLCGASMSFSLIDLGCGYGALLDLLHDRYAPGAIDYLGVDLSGAMISLGQRRWLGSETVRVVMGSVALRRADYAVASGTFNVKLGHSTKSWETFIATTLDGLAACSRKGFAVNFMLPAPPGIHLKAGLYTTGPEPWAEYCRHTFNAEVHVRSDYGLREFTLIVRPS